MPARFCRNVTRFSSTSDLAILNTDPDRPLMALRPTIASVLSHARVMSEATDGTVDVAMLDARCAAESGAWPELSAPSRAMG